MSATDPREPAWKDSLACRSEDEAKTWLKVEIMLAFHRGTISGNTAQEVTRHFGLKTA